MEWTVRKAFSNGNGGNCYYYHKEVEAENKREAIKKAKENDNGWRWIDTFDGSDEVFVHYNAWKL